MSHLEKTIPLGTLPQRDAELARILDRMYTDLVNAVSSKPGVYLSTSVPSNSAEINKSFDTGDFWLKTDTNKLYQLTSRTTPTAVTWSILN